MGNLLRSMPKLIMCISGPVGNPHFGHQWPFQSYVPDVVVSLDRPTQSMKSHLT